MKLIIGIDEKIYEKIQSGEFWLSCGLNLSNAYDFIKNGTPIPDNATNGEVMRAIFPDGVKTSIAYPRDISKEWINAPYQKGGKDE